MANASGRTSWFIGSLWSLRELALAEVDALHVLASRGAVVRRMTARRAAHGAAARLARRSRLFLSLDPLTFGVGDELVIRHARERR
jgi:hypothetical protein